MGCHSNENNLFFTQKANGIMGIGPSALSGEAILDKIFKECSDREHVTHKVFSICLAEWGGQFNVGGFDESLHTGQVKRIRLKPGGFYSVQLTAMKVNGASISTTWGSTMIDSGTTYTYMRSSNYRALMSAIETYCRGHQCGGTKHGTKCWTLPHGPEKFPHISVVFDGVETKKGRTDTYCYGFEDDGPRANTVLGAVWMTHQDIIFDMEKNEVGIAPANCPEYKDRDRPSHSAKDCSSLFQAFGTPECPIAEWVRRLRLFRQRPPPFDYNCGHDFIVQPHEHWWHPSFARQCRADGVTWYQCTGPSANLESESEDAIPARFLGQDPLHFIGAIVAGVLSACLCLFLVRKICFKTDKHRHVKLKEDEESGMPPQIVGQTEEDAGFDAFVIGDDETEHLDEFVPQHFAGEDAWSLGGAVSSVRPPKEAAARSEPDLLDSLDGALEDRESHWSEKKLGGGNGGVCVFLCFSHFSQFHPVLMQNQCGDVTMRVMEYESQRAQVRREDMERRQRRVQELELEEKCTAEDKKLLAKDEKKYKLQMRKQNKLMHVCLCVLLNLAEEISIEKKMVNRKMPTLLLQLLDRSQEDLLLGVLTFLKKLSVFEENKDQIAIPQTLNNLVRLAQHPNARISLLALRLLFNLSFDERVRAALVESGIIKLLVDLLKNPPFRHIVLRLLYHFSMDDRCKSLMAYHRDGMIMLLQLVVHFPEPRVGKDLVALMVNLAAHARAAEVIVQSGLFPAIVLRVLKHRDPLLCKVIRHVASHSGVLEQMYELLQSEDVRMAKWMHEFVRMAVCSVDNPDMLVEVLGTLANVTLEEAAARADLFAMVECSSAAICR
eukprot:s1751_g14.t1